MARLETNGIADLCLDLMELGDSAGELMEDMLEAEAKVVQEALSKSKSIG